jgi:hypothetical protein
MLGELVMALTARALATSALPAIALCFLSANAFAQTPGDARGPAGAANETNVLGEPGEHMGCDRLCWSPDPFHPPGTFTCVFKFSTQAAVDNLNHAVSSKSIAVGKPIMLSSGPVTSGMACARREDIPVWGYVRAKKVFSITPVPPFRVGLVLNILVTDVDPNQKEAVFFPDPNTKDAINPSADADNK